VVSWLINDFKHNTDQYHEKWRQLLVPLARLPKPHLVEQLLSALADPINSDSLLKPWVFECLAEVIENAQKEHIASGDLLQIISFLSFFLSFFQISIFSSSSQCHVFRKSDR